MQTNFKRDIEDANEGPALIRALARVQMFGIGSGVRATYARWSERQRSRRHEQLNGAARNAYAQQPPDLTEVQRRIVDDLARTGMAHVDIRQLPGGAAWWEKMSKAAEQWLTSDDVKEREDQFRAATKHKGKDYLIRMFGRNAAMPWDSVWLRFAVDPAILDPINTYLALMAKVIYVDVWNTVPLATERPSIGSQKWHRDPEDARLVKVFLYLRDADNGSGAFEYVPESRAGEKYGHLWPQQFPKGSIPPEDEFNAAIPREDRHLCAYPAGTLLFADTSGFHRGGRAEQTQRVVATWTFTSQACVWPRAFVLDRHAGPGDDLSVAARFALLTPDEPSRF